MSSREELDYLQEQTIAEVVKNALQIYRKYFKKFFFSYFLLMLPATGLGILGLTFSGDSPFAGLSVYWAIWFVASGVASLIVTIVVSDICLGQPPSLKRAWKHISVKLVAKLLVTSLIFYSLFLMFIVLGFFLLLWLDQWQLPSWAYFAYVLLVLILFLVLVSLFLFVPIIVVLENRWGFRALKRSVTLAYGYHARNFVIVFMMFGLVTIVPVILYVISFTIPSEKWGPVPAICLYYVIGFLIQPLGLIYIVLLYYDTRVRKEDYDSSALAEDLRH